MAGKRPPGPGRGHRIKQGNGPASGGPANGPGWGGPASGGPARGMEGLAMRNYKSVAERVAQRASKEARIEAMVNEIEGIAYSEEPATTRLSAAVAFLNRMEGLPVARNLNADASVGYVVYGEREAESIETWKQRHLPAP